ncbi:MAG TPA: alpha/beta hydrolase [Steroidobacteraceae bacterium]|nr:alpha/beta hydrolase [Steroidobacteraceae bacterium]
MKPVFKRRSLPGFAFKAMALLLPMARAYAAPPVPSAPALTLSAYAQPAQLVTLPGGRRLNIRCTGQTSPTIILTAGAGDQSLSWRAIQGALSGTARVCAWDRPGFGFSDPSTTAQDVVHLTDNLEAALAAATIRPPYVLVGHSLGSFETLMFAFRHPHDIAGMVLIDPAGPFQDERFKRAAPATYAAIDAFQTRQIEHLKRCIREMEKKQPTSDAARAGDDCVMTPEKEYPSDLNRALIRIDSKVANKKDFLSLLTNMTSGLDSRELKRAWHPLGNIPLIVLTAGEPPPIPLTGAAKAQMPALQAEWARMHDEMGRLSTQGSNRVVPDATHYIHQDRPQVVVDAINEVISAARKREGSPERVPKASRRTALQRRLLCRFIVGASAILFSPCTSAAEPRSIGSQSLEVGGHALHFRVFPG